MTGCVGIIPLASAFQSSFKLGAVLAVIIVSFGLKPLRSGLYEYVVQSPADAACVGLCGNSDPATISELRMRATKAPNVRGKRYRCIPHSYLSRISLCRPDVKTTWSQDRSDFSNGPGHSRWTRGRSCHAREQSR